MVPLRARRRPRRATGGPAAAVALALVCLLAGAGAAAASCQTPLCQQGYRLGERQREEALRQDLLADPASLEAARGLLRILEHKVARERAIAAYEAAAAWEPSDFDGPALEAEVAEEIRLLSALVARLAADDPGALCQHARSLPEPAQRVARLQQALRGAPSAQVADELTVCLAWLLHEEGELASARALLRQRLDVEPSLLVGSRLAELLGRVGADAEAFAVFDELAERLADDPAARFEGIWKAIPLTRRLGSEGEEKRRRLATQAREHFARGEIGAQDYSSVCSALGTGEEVSELAWECYRDLLGRTRGAAAGTPAAHARHWALRALAVRAARGGVDARVGEVLAAAAAEGEIESTWRTLVDFSRGELCSRFLGAWAGGGIAPPAGAPHDLAFALERCGREEAARRLYEAAGVPDPRRADRLAELIAERRGGNPWIREEALPRRLDGLVAQATAAHVASLEEWVGEGSRDPLPFLLLAAIAERDDDFAAVLRHLEAATVRRPDDHDLLTHLAATALRLGQPEIARDAARRLLAARGTKERHRAEGDYVLGRLALAEGRDDEASDRLARYFLTRLAHEGCAPTAHCDTGLLAHLYRQGDEERLRSYLAARRETGEVLARLRPELVRGARGTVAARRGPRPRLATWEVAPTLRALGCPGLPPPPPDEDVMLETEWPPRGAVRGADGPIAPTAPGGAEGAAGETAGCVPENLPDPIEALDQADLLGLWWQLRAVD